MTWMGAPLSTVSLSPLPPAVSATRLPLSAGTSCASALEIAVRNTFNGEPLLLDSLRYQNGAGETLAVTRLSMLLSGFAIEREKGEWVERNWRVCSCGRKSIGCKRHHDRWCCVPG